MTALCSSCKHWRGSNDEATDPRDSWGTCRMVAGSPMDEVDFYVIDGELYPAELRTRPTFGCNQWEPES